MKSKSMELASKAQAWRKENPNKVRAILAVIAIAALVILTSR